MVSPDGVSGFVIDHAIDGTGIEAENLQVIFGFLEGLDVHGRVHGRARRRGR
jgi:hypothetical protein